MCKVKPIEHLEEVSSRLAQKHPDLHLLDKIKQRLAHLELIYLNPATTLAIAVTLQSSIHIDGLQEKNPSFQAWKRASYDFLCQEFGQENLIYLHLAQDKLTPTIQCIFVPIKSNQLLPQAFVGTLAQQQGYLDRYQAVLDRLLEQGQSQANQLPTRQKPSAHTYKPDQVSGLLVSTNGFHESIKAGLERVKKDILP